MQIGPVELGKCANPDKAEAASDLVRQQFEHAHNAVLARRGERVALHAAEPNEIGASRDRFDDIAPAAECAVDHDLGASRNRVHDLG